MEEQKLQDAIKNIILSKEWDLILNEISSNPSPEGKLRCEFDDGIIDLRIFEKYIMATLPLINLKKVLRYKSQRLYGNKKGYLKEER